MRRGQCMTCGKTKTQFIKRDATGGSFANTLVNKLHFEMHLQDITIRVRNKTLYKIEPERNAKGVKHTDK